MTIPLLFASRAVPSASAASVTPRSGRRVRAALLCGVSLLAAIGINCARVGVAAAAEPAPAADPHAVQPERPTLATHAHTVAPGWVEIETGIERDRFADDSRIESSVTTAKIGLATRCQLALTLNALRDPADASHTSGMGDAAVALKYRPLDGAPGVGDFAFVAALKLPTGSRLRGTGTGTTDASLLLISSRTFGPVSLDVNAGGTVRSGDGEVAPAHASVWTAALGLPLAGTLGWAAELYGYPGTDGASGAAPVIAVLFGPTWTPRAWLELDAGAIVPVNGPQPHALYAGLVWNVGSLRRNK